MIEAPTTDQTREAMKVAHAERGKAFRHSIRAIVRMFGA